jgi:MtN3 and saliva related transmembrane protein
MSPPPVCRLTCRENRRHPAWFPSAWNPAAPAGFDAIGDRRVRISAVDLPALTGAAAALCSTASFAPQAWKIIRTRDTAAISARMYLLTVAAFALWLGYGVLRGDWALIAPNAVCLALSAFILAMKLLPQRKKEAVAAALDPKS